MKKVLRKIIVCAGADVAIVPRADEIRARMQGDTVSSVHEPDGWNHTSLVTAAAAEVIVTVPGRIAPPFKSGQHQQHSHTLTHTGTQTQTVVDLAKCQ